MLEQLTYAQIGARLAPTMAEPWSLSISMSCNKPMPARSPCDQAVIDVVATLKTRIEQLEADWPPSGSATNTSTNVPTCWPEARRF